MLTLTSYFGFLLAALTITPALLFLNRSSGYGLIWFQRTRIRFGKIN